MRLLFASSTSFQISAPPGPVTTTRCLVAFPAMVKRYFSPASNSIRNTFWSVSDSDFEPTAPKSMATGSESTSAGVVALTTSE